MTVGIAPPSQVTPMGDDLYREIILDHFRHPRHQGDVERPTARVEASNPLCGDEVTVTWRTEAGRLADIAFSGRGCSISQASASILCDTLHGLPVSEAADVARRFRALLVEHGPAAELGDLEALSGVAAYPVRIKCALLACNALLGELEGTAT